MTEYTCAFKNEHMNKPCGRKLFKVYAEKLCLVHGTVSFNREAWDSVENPNDTYETENGGLSWSQEEISRLLDLEENGVSVIEISRILSRTRNAVYNKLWSLKGKG